MSYGVHSTVNYRGRSDTTTGSRTAARTQMNAEGDGVASSRYFALRPSPTKQVHNVHARRGGPAEARSENSSPRLQGSAFTASAAPLCACGRTEPNIRDSFGAQSAMVGSPAPCVCMLFRACYKFEE